jgi:hypothetical protein
MMYNRKEQREREDTYRLRSFFFHLYDEKKKEIEEERTREQASRSLNKHHIFRRRVTCIDLLPLLEPLFFTERKA